MTTAFGNWIVAKKPANIDQQELTIWEHFDKIEADRSGIETVLVREDGQNRIDRQADESIPVRIRMFFSGTQKALAVSKAKEYFEGLEDHLVASEVIKADDATFSKPCEFVVIECFGTTGLVGDETQHFRMELDAENHFLSFFRAFGVSGNSRNAAKGGSWGVGKSVYFYSSKIRTIFGLSIRDHIDVNRKRVLMGKSVMKYHRIGDKPYVNVGHLGVLQNTDELVSPFYDRSLLDQFSQDFNLKRKDESGLSVVIPYCESTESDVILHAIISEYGGSILKGRLEVELELPDSAVIALDKNSLFTILANQPDVEPWKETKELLTLLSAGELIPVEKVIELPEIIGGTQISEIELSEETRNQILGGLDSGEVVRIEVPVKVFLADRTSGNSRFRIYMQMTEQRVGIKPVFFRDALRISGITPNQEINGIRTVFIADGLEGDRILTDLLRLSEGPSHTEWKSKQKVKEKYQHVPTWLKLCKGMPKRLVSQVRGNREEPNNQSLADLFPDSGLRNNATNRGSSKRDSGKGRVGNRGGSGGGGGGGGGSAIEAFQIGKTEKGCGFEVRVVDGVDTKMTFTVEMAYERSRGTGSFKQWKELDFTTKQLKIACVGGVVKKAIGNQIVVAIKDSQKLCLSVTGFDSNRNPLVKINQGDKTK